MQKEGKSEVLQIGDLPSWNHKVLQLLGEPRSARQPSFIIQFPFYMSHPCMKGESFAKVVKVQRQEDRRAGRGSLWKAGAGVTSKNGYVAASFAHNLARVISPRIIAGFMPVMPQSRVDLLKINEDPRRKLKTPVGDLVPRFSLEEPDWRPARIEAIDFAPMLFGFAAERPDFGIKFFGENTKFTFVKAK